MRRDIALYVSAAFFLLLAIAAGRLSTAGGRGENAAAEATVRTGVSEIGNILADLLWIQMDRYHHIWMYQGEDWTSATDYLPQLWLVIRLRPGFPDAYIDGAYHLGINLGLPGEAMDLLDQGIRNCPESERVFWERLVILWQSDFRGPEATRNAAWDYLHLVKRKGGRISEPWNEANAAMIVGFTFLDQTGRRNSSRLASRYDQRRETMMILRDIGGF